MDWLVWDQAVIDTLNELAEEFPRLGFWKYVGVLSMRAAEEVPRVLGAQQ